MSQGDQGTMKPTNTPPAMYLDRLGHQRLSGGGDGDERCDEVFEFAATGGGF
jgi:hypothetical protein